MGEIVEHLDLKYYVDENYPASKEPIREYESHVLGFCIIIADRNKVFVDIGACTGKYSIPMSKHYGMVIAIEPNPKNIEFLRKNIELNKCDNIVIIDKAVSNTKGKTKLALKGAQSFIEAYNVKDSIEVETDTLDNLIEKADVIKIDVEGAELKVIEGSERIIDEHKPIFVVEHNEYWSGDKPKTHLDIMKKLIAKGYYPFNYNYVHWIYVPKEKISNFAGQLSEYALGRLLSHHIFYEVIIKNIKEGKPWYYGLPNTWWYGMSILEFVSVLVHKAPYEKEWLDLYKKTIFNNYGFKI